MTGHRTTIEPFGAGCRAVCACGYRGRERTEAELAIHDAEQHERVESRDDDGGEP